MEANRESVARCAPRQVMDPSAAIPTVQIIAGVIIAALSWAVVTWLQTWAYFNWPRTDHPSDAKAVAGACMLFLWVGGGMGVCALLSLLIRTS